MQFYKSSILTNAALEAINLLRELQDIVMQIQLPLTVKNPEVKLKYGQKDISQDPKKVFNYVLTKLMKL